MRRNYKLQTINSRLSYISKLEAGAGLCPAPHVSSSIDIIEKEVERTEDRLFITERAPFKRLIRLCTEDKLISQIFTTFSRGFTSKEGFFIFLLTFQNYTNNKPFFFTEMKGKRKRREANIEQKRNWTLSRSRAVSCSSCCKKIHI